MKTPQLPQVARLACFLLLIHLLISCDSLTSSQLTDQDREYFQTVYANIGKSWNEGNRQPYLDRFTDNTVLMVPNQEVISDLSSIKQLVNAFPKINIEFTVTEIWGNSSQANVAGVYDVTDVQGNIFDQGKFISLWQKDGEGNWKITHDIWNSDLPATNPIEGGWYLISGEYDGNKRGGSEPYQFKLFSAQHFALLMQTPAGEWKNSTTGSYSLSGDTFSETIEFSNRPEYVGMTLDWKYEVQGDTLFMEGPGKIVNEEGEEVANDSYNTMREIRIRAK
jgi:ketosteroid isomerase-like protein